MLTRLDAWISGWEDAHGVAEACGLAEDYRARCDTLGRRVRVTVSPERVLEGQATGVDEEGRLLLDADEAEGQLQAFGAGDVEHLRRV